MTFQKTQIEPPMLNDVPAAFLRDQKGRGLRRLYWPDQRTTRAAQAWIKKAWAEFRKEITSDSHPPVGGIFCYDCPECRGDYAKNDGICAWMDGRTEYFIGIAKTVFESEDYTLLVFLHELCHVLAWTPEGHDRRYEEKLNAMLTQYNREHGTDLKNDYAGYRGDKRR